MNPVVIREILWGWNSFSDWSFGTLTWKSRFQDFGDSIFLVRDIRSITPFKYSYLGQIFPQGWLVERLKDSQNGRTPGRFKSFSSGWMIKIRIQGKWMANGWMNGMLIALVSSESNHQSLARLFQRNCLCVRGVECFFLSIESSSVLKLASTVKVPVR